MDPGSHIPMSQYAYCGTLLYRYRELLFAVCEVPTLELHRIEFAGSVSSGLCHDCGVLKTK